MVPAAAAAALYFLRTRIREVDISKFLNEMPWLTTCANVNFMFQLQLEFSGSNGQDQTRRRVVYFSKKKIRKKKFEKFEKFKSVF
jgi:hypothetical protein